MKTSKGIYSEANKAGKAAAKANTPEPMYVYDSSIDKHYAPVMGGVCGFAWIDVRPRNSKFAKFLKANDLARSSDYDRSMKVWIFDYGQSMEKKESYAHAFANVLRSYDIDASSGSRMD